MAEKTMTITRKITLFPQGDKEEIDRVYKYIRNGCEVQSQMMNQCISALYAAKISQKTKEEINEMMKLYSHIPTSGKGSAYDYDMEKYPTGLPVAGSIPHFVKQKFDKACKDGLLYGRVSLPTFRADAPLMVHNDFVNIRRSKVKSGGHVIDTGLYHDYETPMQLVDALKSGDKPAVHIKFANGIVFDVVFGNPHRSAELRSVIGKAFSGEYKICDSSIGIEKKKIILNLSLQIPIQERKLDENVICGVDLGLSVPAMCALNGDMYKRENIGSFEEFARQRIKIQAERRRIQKRLKDAKGGHGRKDKLKHLETIQLHERNFAKTYNHMVSRHVVDFAAKNNAKYIHLEDLSVIPKDRRDEFCLRNWSWYELQQMIKYKAQMQGIEVRLVNPANTSQICSVCGEIGVYDWKDDRNNFYCTNPACRCQSMYGHKNKIHADFNAARNIAMSQDFMDTAAEKKAKKKAAAAQTISQTASQTTASTKSVTPVTA